MNYYPHTLQMAEYTLHEDHWLHAQGRSKEKAQGTVAARNITVPTPTPLLRFEAVAHLHFNDKRINFTKGSGAGTEFFRINECRRWWRTWAGCDACSRYLGNGQTKPWFQLNPSGFRLGRMRIGT